MSKVLSTLKQISDSMEELGNSMCREEQVYEAELRGRLAKNLQGDEAVKHYNEWMENAGMKHLMVK